MASSRRPSLILIVLGAFQLVYPVGVPLFFFFILFVNRNNLKVGRDSLRLLGVLVLSRHGSRSGQTRSALLASCTARTKDRRGGSSSAIWYAPHHAAASRFAERASTFVLSLVGDQAVLDEHHLVLP